MCRTVGGYGLRETAGEFGSFGCSGVARVVGRLNMKTDRNISKHLLKIWEILEIENGCPKSRLDPFTSFMQFPNRTLLG